MTNLQLVLELFLTPLKKILSQNKISTLFSNIDMICELNKNFLQKLEAEYSNVYILFYFSKKKYC